MCHQPTILNQFLKPSLVWRCRYCEKGQENPHTLNPFDSEQPASGGGSGRRRRRGTVDSTPPTPKNMSRKRALADEAKPKTASPRNVTPDAEPPAKRPKLSKGSASRAAVAVEPEPEASGSDAGAERDNDQASPAAESPPAAPKGVAPSALAPAEAGDMQVDEPADDEPEPENGDDGAEPEPEGAEEEQEQEQEQEDADDQPAANHDHDDKALDEASDAIEVPLRPSAVSMTATAPVKRVSTSGPVDDEAADPSYSTNSIIAMPEVRRTSQRARKRRFTDLPTDEEYDDEEEEEYDEDDEDYHDPDHPAHHRSRASAFVSTSTGEQQRLRSCGRT